MTERTFTAMTFTEPDPGVGLITMNRPERLNAIDPDMLMDFEALFTRLAQDETIRVLILTGAGRGFCSGADLSEAMANRNSDAFADPEHFLRIAQERYAGLILGLRAIPQPVIAAVNGPAVGLGMLFVLYSDIIFASEKGRFGDGHIKLGIAPGDGAFVMWSLLCGIGRAKEYLWTGKIIDANEAYRIGLVNHVVPHDELIPEVMDFARKLAKGPSLAIEFTKRAYNKRIRDEFNLVFDLSYAMQTLSYFTEDHKEGPRTFLEKREPHFQGR